MSSLERGTSFPLNPQDKISQINRDQAVFGRAELENNTENLPVMLPSPSAFAEVENGIQPNTGYFSHCCISKGSHLVPFTVLCYNRLEANTQKPPFLTQRTYRWWRRRWQVVKVQITGEGRNKSIGLQTETKYAKMWMWEVLWVLWWKKLKRSMKQNKYLQINPSERDCHNLGHEKFQRFFFKCMAQLCFAPYQRTVRWNVLVMEILSSLFIICL